MTLPRTLGATYRLQLRPGFGFTEAARLVPYLARLGAETVYCSPVAEAVPGSTHGYDGVDPGRLRGELGGDTGYRVLVDTCDAAGLGICIDLVPNHLSTWSGGPWWRRLLSEGPTSEMAEVFDVDWDAGGRATRGTVTLPLLDRPLDDALRSGGVRLAARDGAPVVEVGEVDLPVAGGHARPDDDIREVLAAQHYRLVDWHDRQDRNYRRFFDIDGLVGVRVEVPHVFDLTHRLVTELARSGRLSALRVDHVDGLRDPTAYLRRLAAATDVPIVVEKILTGGEALRATWPVVGTTGYETVDAVGGVLVDPDGYEQLRAAGRADGDQPVGPLTVTTRRLVARTSFPGEMERVAQRLGVPAAELEEAVVRLPRYRTYLRPIGPAGDGGVGAGDGGVGAGDGGVGAGEAPDDPEDVAVWRSLAAAGPWAGEEGRSCRAVVETVLRRDRRSGALRVQQLTGALMAKGVEDTAWYRLSGPLAFCEVGGDPGRDRHDGPERWHAWCADRVAAGATGLVPGTTHDTKRSEDVRCRLYALSELPAELEAGLARFRRALGLPEDGGDLAFESRVLAQTTLGILPARPGADGDAELSDRLGAALEKSAREAKRRSSWTDPDTAYEGRLRTLASQALADGAALTKRCFGTLVDDVARLGAINSLSSVVLRHTLPGIPDCYQGDESWNLSLVDPDNRRPVDWAALGEAASRSLGEGGGGGAGARRGGEMGGDVDALRRSWRDGRVKLVVTARCLAARRAARPALRPGAGYEPVGSAGPARPSVLAYARHGPSVGADRAGTTVWAIAVTTRLARSLDAAPGDLPRGSAYAGTSLLLPDGAPRRFRDALSGDVIEAPGRVLPLDAVLRKLPVALLVASAPG